MRILPSFWIFLLFLFDHAYSQSSNQSFDLLGSDFLLSLGGGLILTPDLADSTPNCRLQHTLLQECLLSECRTFTRQCPASNAQTPPTTSTLTCEGISETICTVYENCCMTECALELQTWALCIDQETSIGGEKGLSCGVPTCNDQNSVLQTGGSNETDTNTDTNETTTNNNNETSATTTNTTEEVSEPTTTTMAPTDAGSTEEEQPECEYIDNGQRVVCSHFFNVTSATTKTNTKLAESILECAAPPPSTSTAAVTIDFILETPNPDCSCLGTTLWGTGDVIEECQCGLCQGPGALRIELFECTAGTTTNDNSAFVIDDCVEQTCEGECVRLESEPPSTGPTLFPTTIQPSTTAPTTIQPSTVAPSSTMPSLVPTVSYTTMAPTTGIVVFTPSPTANVFPPPGPTTPNAPTSPPTMSGQTALPSLGLDHQQSIPPSAGPSAAPSLAPSIANSNNTTTNSPTTTSNTTATATTQSPVPRPATTDTSTTTTTTSTTPPPITNALRQQSTLVAFVGALVGTVGLIVVLVVTKKGSVGELTRARDASAARQKMAQMASNRHIFSSKSSRDINSAAAASSPTSPRGLPVSSRGMPGAVNGHGNGHRGGGVV